MPSRTPYEEWIQKEHRASTRKRNWALLSVLIYLIIIWAGVTWIAIEIV